MLVADALSGVWICDAECGQCPRLQIFHYHGFRIVKVIIAEKMQKSMNHEVREMVLEPLAFKCGLPRHRFAGQNNVARASVPRVRPA